MVEPEEQDETPPEVRAPIPTTTITLMVIDDTVRDLILAGCDAAEDGAAAEGEEPDAYYQKVRDRLGPDAEPGKVTLPDVLLTPEVLDAIQSYVATELVSKDAPKREGEEDAPRQPLHPDVTQTLERLGLSEKDE
jgi:hypothetical protein